MEFFKKAKIDFDEFLPKYGFKLASEHYNHESFGNSYAEYYRSDIRLRLIWDGKEQSLYVDISDIKKDSINLDWNNIEDINEGALCPFDLDTSIDRVMKIKNAIIIYLEKRQHEKSAGVHKYFRKN